MITNTEQLENMSISINIIETELSLQTVST